MKAVERFDPAKGGKLSTYAHGGSAVHQGRWLIRARPSVLPCICGQNLKMRRVSLQMSEELGRDRRTMTW